MDYLKIVIVITYALNLLGTILVLVGTWKMIFSSKPALHVLVQGGDDTKIRLKTIIKWFLGKTTLIFQFAEKYESVTIPEVLELSLKYLVGGVLLQFIANSLFFVISFYK